MAPLPSTPGRDYGTRERRRRLPRLPPEAALVPADRSSGGMSVVGDRPGKGNARSTAGPRHGRDPALRPARHIGGSRQMCQAARTNRRRGPAGGPRRSCDAVQDGRSGVQMSDTTVPHPVDEIAGLSADDRTRFLTGGGCVTGSRRAVELLRWPRRPNSRITSLGPDDRSPGGLRVMNPRTSRRARSAVAAVLTALIAMFTGAGAAGISYAEQGPCAMEPIPPECFPPPK